MDGQDTWWVFALVLAATSTVTRVSAPSPFERGRDRGGGAVERQSDAAPHPGPPPTGGGERWCPNCCHQGRQLGDSAAIRNPRIGWSRFARGHALEDVDPGGQKRESHPARWLEGIIGEADRSVAEILPTRDGTRTRDLSARVARTVLSVFTPF